MQHGMEAVNPLMGIRWRPPKALSLSLLEGVLLQVGQHEEPFVRPPRYGTVVIRTVTTGCAGLPIDGAVL